MFRSLRKIIVFSAINVAISATLHAGDPNRLMAPIAPFLDEQAILVAHVDLTQIDLDAVVANVLKLIPLKESDIAELKKQAGIAKIMLDAFIKAGGRDVFSVFSLVDLSNLSHEPPVFIVVPVAAGGDPNALLAMVKKLCGSKEKVERLPANGPIVVGEAVVIERLRAMQSVERPYINAAFAAMDSCSIKVLFLPNDDHRRVLHEMLPKLPEPLTAIDGPTLADGLLWAGLGMNITPELRAQLAIGSQDAHAAQRMAIVWQQLFDAAGAEITRQMESGPPTARELLPMVDKIKPLLQPQIKDNQLIITLEGETIHSIVQQVFLPAVVKARQNATRAQRMNQFKQIAVAMHNWHEQNKSLPPAAIRDENGKPLLSWRVAILPYLEEGAKLYDQFHLDEPWDSERNRKLIEKMPDVFKDPELVSKVTGSQLAPGQTTYMVPVGEGLVFGGKEGIPFQAIKDGTSNTILLVEVSPEHAVPWTKPADWEVDFNNPLAGLKRTDRDNITIGFCDGSVRTAPNDIAPDKFWKMLTRAGGEVIED